MTLKNKIFPVSFSGFVVLLLPVMALAQVLPPAPFTSLGAFQSFICTVVVGWLFTFFIVLAVVLAVVAAYYILTSGGDPDRTSYGYNAIFYFVIAIVVALFARGFPLIVGSLFSGGAGGVSC